jgi:predicted transposase YbfD/YdcC
MASCGNLESESYHRRLQMLKSFLDKIKDHRRKQGRRYQLGHILLFSIFAILSGATSYRKVQAFIQVNYEVLDEIFGLNWKRLPAHTTIRAIIQGTAAAEIEASFRQYSEFLAGSGTEKRFVAFDGKVLRGSFDHFQDQKAIQILSAFLTHSRIILAHAEIAEKTNEIPTAQELMTKLGLSGCVFTFDAINCQEKTLAVAEETNNDVIVQVKENQKTLFNDCQTTAETMPPADVYQEPVTKARNRIESRKVEVFTHMTISDKDKWHLVEAIVQVERKRQVFDTKTKCWKRSDETSFYVATTVFSAQVFCQAIRNHWGIENSNHHVRDVTMGEDKSRIRTNPHIFAKLRSFALNIIRANNVENVSLELFNNCMNLDNILNYVGVM